MWSIEDNCLYGDENRCLYYYDKQLEDIYIKSFLNNIKYIQEYYEYSEYERRVFPILFRYINSFWWHHIHELEKIKDDKEKVSQLLDWIERQMTRDDIRLP